MFGFWLPLARAATYTVPGSGDTVADVLDIADRYEPIEILIDPSHTSVGDAVDVSGLEISIRSSVPGSVALAPAIGAVDGGCTVSLTDLRLDSGGRFNDGSGNYEAAVFMKAADALTMESVAIGAATAHALVLWDTPSELSRLSFDGALTGSAIWVYATSVAPVVHIVDTSFEGLTNGAIYADNTTRSRGMELLLERVAFLENSGTPYADIWANMARVELTDTAFVHHPAYLVDPLYLQNFNFVCTRCDVDARRGTSFLFSPLVNSDDTAEVTESRFRVGPGDEVLKFAGGTDVVLADTLVEMMDGSATLVALSSGTLTMEGVDVRGTSVLGGSDYVVATSGSTVTLTRTRLCRLSSAKPIYLSGSSMTAERLILQAVTSTADHPALWTYDAYAGVSGSVTNSTFAGSAAGAAFGGDATVAYDITSTLVTDNIVGLQIDLGGVWTTDAYNLWYGNTTDTDLAITAPPAEEPASGSPSLSGFNPNDCDTWPVPDAGSVVTDRGHPDDVDPDGTRADIGAIPAGGSIDIGWHGPYEVGPADEDTADTGDTGDTGAQDDTGDSADTGDSGDTSVDTAETGDVPGDTAEDLDGDGVTAGDCAPEDPNIHPGATEIAADGVDQDCDGADLEISFGGGTCGCASSPVTGGWLLLLIASVLTGRRRA